MADSLKSREKNSKKQVFGALFKIISSSAEQGLTHVKKSASESAITPKKGMSTVTSNLANQEFQVNDRHRLQAILPKPSTKIS